MDGYGILKPDISVDKLEYNSKGELKDQYFNQYSFRRERHRFNFRV